VDFVLRFLSDSLKNFVNADEMEFLRHVFEKVTALQIFAAAGAFKVC